MRITAIVRTVGACDFYRAVQPLKMIKKHTPHSVTVIRAGDNADDMMEGLSAEVLLIPRVVDKQMLGVIKGWQKTGKKIVVDFDDDCFSISPLSPHYEDHGLEEVTVMMPNGKYEKLWEDGKDFSIENNRKNLEVLKDAVRLADMVTVTTPILAEVYGQYNDNVVSLPNCVDFDLWQPMRLVEDDEIRLFWAGGSSHFEDWMLLQDVLPEVMEKYPNVKLVLLGMKFDATISKIPEDRVEFHDWVDTAAYPHVVARLNPTIGLIPLCDNKFSSAKSCIKWVEMSSLEVPCVTSNVSPYKEIATEENGIFIDDNNKKSWVKGISMLIEDRMLRAKMGGAAKRYAESNFSAKTNAKLWVEAYESLLNVNRKAV